MKICLYNVTTTYAYGGIETYCIEIGKTLVRRGHRATIVAGLSASCTFREPSLEVRQFPFKSRSNFPDLGIRFRKLMERLSFGRHALSHLMEAGYDAVIVTKPFDFPVFWWAKKRGLQAKIIFHAGGTDFFAGDRLFASAVDHWVACSRHTAQQVGARYRRKVQTITNGVDTQLFAPGKKNPLFRTQWKIPADAPLIMSVGRLVGLKGLRVILEAISTLPQAHYAVVGQGEECERLETLAKRLGLSARVHFLGGIAHESLPEVLRQADVFVQPSIGEEAFGITVVEAMATGLAVAASRTGGMQEIIQDGKNGVLLPPSDVATWREALGLLLRDNQRRVELGKNARTHTEKNFTWVSKAEQLEKLLQSGSP
jgi:glycosyltransferase involved in cell wall biosynthesis